MSQEKITARPLTVADYASWMMYLLKVRNCIVDYYELTKDPLLAEVYKEAGVEDDPLGAKAARKSIEHKSPEAIEEDYYWAYGERSLQDRFIYSPYQVSLMSDADEDTLMQLTDKEFKAVIDECKKENMDFLSGQS